MKTSILTVTVALVAVALVAYLLSGNQSPQVIVYVSHDQDYSEPVFKEFEKNTGIAVKAVYDTETTKTTGLVNRLLAESGRPQADVFWNNEVSRTIMLKERGVLDAYASPNAQDKPAIYKDAEGYWTGFAARARVIIYNTQLVKDDEAPKKLSDLTDPKWNGKFGIANPMFGTTGSHAAALFAYWGEENAREYFSQLKKNGVKIVESNGMVKNQVAAGDLFFGLTDTDDANDAIVAKTSVKMIYPDQGEEGMGTLLIPNTVMLIKGAPNKENAKKLIDYILSAEVEGMLSESKAVQMPLGKGVNHPDNVPDIKDLTGMNVTQEDIYNSLKPSQDYLKELFIV